MSRYNLRSSTYKDLDNSAKESSRGQSSKSKSKQFDNTYKRRARLNKSMASNPTFRDIKDFMATMSDVDQLCPLLKSSGKIDVTKFDFNGFNPRKCLIKLLGIIHAKKKSKSDALKDMIDMIVIGLSRGNIRGDQLDKTVEGDGAARIEQLANIYGIVMRKKASEKVVLMNDDLTFIRMTLLFPHIAATILNGNPSIVKDGMLTNLGSERLPDCMKFAGFSSLIPVGLDRRLLNVLKYASIAYQIDFSYMINQDLMGKSLQQVFAIQLPFWNAGHRGGWLNDAQRVYYLRALGLTKIDVFESVLDVGIKALKLLANCTFNPEDIRKDFVVENVLTWPTELAIASSEDKQYVTDQGGVDPTRTPFQVYVRKRKGASKSQEVNLPKEGEETKDQSAKIIEEAEDKEIDSSSE